MKADSDSNPDSRIVAVYPPLMRSRVSQDLPETLFRKNDRPDKRKFLKMGVQKDSRKIRPPLLRESFKLYSAGVAGNIQPLSYSGPFLPTH